MSPPNKLYWKPQIKIKGGDDCCREAFHDFVSINSELGRHERIVELFKWVDKNKPTAAKKYFSLAMPTLVQAKEFSLCGKYIEPKKKVEQLKELYAINLELAKDSEFGDGMQEYTENSFVNGITMLVAILVQNNRHEQASTISDKSIAVLDTAKFKSKLSKVMAGDMPAPWP